ncbi:Transcriptional regulator, GntR family with aminotransferase domain (fragment) [Serratia proteamaculans]
MLIDKAEPRKPSNRYRQITELIKQAIHAGLFPPNTRLPSVRTLATQYTISLTTALKTLRTLEDEHYAVAKPKSGFFVTPQQHIQQMKPVVIEQPHEIAPLDEQTELHMAMVSENCRVRLDLANGDSSLYPIKKLSLVMRQLGYSKPFLLGDTVKGTGYPPLKAEIARRAVVGRNG